MSSYPPYRRRGVYSRPLRFPESFSLRHVLFRLGVSRDLFRARDYLFFVVVHGMLGAGV